jgi:hypothetical protein
MKLNKYEMRKIRSEKLKQDLHGEGLYIYENNTDGDMMLPRPTASGLSKVGPRAQFQGDNYYMSLVKSNQCKLIKELVSPEQERKMKEDKDKLILDQPDMITEQGKVEFEVQDDQVQPLNEVGADEEAQPEVLLNEDPIDGVDIILE